MADPLPFPADGFDATWEMLRDGTADVLSLQWDNEAWTASVAIGGHDVEVVVRLSPLWQVRQFLLFRDLAEPDLWVGTDGAGRWGEVNGAHRPDLDGAHDVSIARTPFCHALPIRRLPLLVGQAAELRTLEVDVETLGIVTVDEIYERTGTQRWRVIRRDHEIEFDVDEYGLPCDIPGRCTRTA